MSLRRHISRLRGLLGHRSRTEELDEEIRSHLDLETEENRAAGSPLDEARYAARRRFGNVALAKEESRDMWVYRFAEILLQDVRCGLRMLAKTPAFTFVAILTLALGIGATTSIFSVVNTVLLRRLPFADPDRLVRIFSDAPAKGTEKYFVNEGDLTDWRAENRSFEQIAGYWPAEFNLTADGGPPERVRAATASANLFPTLGVSPILGRGFTMEEDTQGGPAAVLLSYGIWKRRFGGNGEILGKQIRLQDAPYTVVGVLPAGMRLLEGTEVWIPQPIRSGVRGPRYLDALGKLKVGVTLEQAKADLQGISRELEGKFPSANQGWSVTLVSMRDQLFGETRTALFVLLGATGLMLLIACVNLANLLLARTESRQKEFAVRVALGASVLRLARQLLVEGLTLSLFGGGVGLLVAYGTVAVLPKFGPQNILRLDEISVDGRVLLFTLVTALLTAMLFGLAPLLHVFKARLDLHSSGSARVSAGLSSRRVSGLLVVCEVALAVVLVSGAGLLLQSFSKLLRVDPGFQTENVILADVGLPYAQYGDAHKVANFYARLAERLAAEPGVRAVGATTSLPLRKDADYRLRFDIPDRPKPENPEEQSAYYRMVTPGYFRAMGMALLAGREFADTDEAQSAGVAVINETLARQYWPGESPLGKRIGIYKGQFGPLGFTLFDSPRIVGVIADVRQAGLQAKPEPSIYLPHRQAPFLGMTLVVRANMNPAGLAAAIRADVESFDRSLPISHVATLEQTLSTAVAQPRFRTLLLSLFAALALLLASIGIYGVMAYSVAQRTNEIGIRMALGARPGQVLQLVLSQGMRMAVAGAAGGILFALLLGRFVSGLLFGVSARDPWTFAGVTLLLTIVALAACAIPAWRAMRVDPMTALRHE
jgi:putative ABC transport system permease protein